MRSSAIRKSVTFAVVLALASCSTARQSPRQLESGKVTQVVVTMNNRMDHATPFWWAAWLASIGLGIGTGNAAHAVGAGSGALLGGGLGYAHSYNESKRVTRMVDVTTDSGVIYRLRSTDSVPPRIGQRVWVAFDKRGRPDHIVTVPSA